MKSPIIVLKTYPDMVNEHSSLNVDYYEVPIRPVIFGKNTSLEEQLDCFKPIKKQVIGIHGAIYREGVNLMDPAAATVNKKSFKFVEEAGNYFQNSMYQLFHPGHLIANTDCSFEVLFDFVKNHRLPKLVLEFEPFFSYQDRLVFPAHSVEDWITFKKKVNLDIVLDTAHCYITANALGYDFYSYFDQLNDALNPKIIHLSTTDLSDRGINDKHLPFHEGSIDFKKIRHCFKDKILVIEVNSVSNKDIQFVNHLVETVTV